jgi:hypothetical protein
MKLYTEIKSTITVVCVPSSLSRLLRTSSPTSSTPLLLGHKTSYKKKKGSASILCRKGNATLPKHA